METDSRRYRYFNYARTAERNFRRSAAHILDRKYGLRRIEKKELKKFARNLHIFGHIHCGYGQTEKFGVKFVNASNCDESYLPTNAPVIVDL